MDVFRTKNMTMLVNRCKEGGFIDERWEKANRIAGYTAAVMIVVMFIVLVAWVIVDAAGEAYIW